MPVPALLGVGWLATAITGVLSTMVAFFATYVGRKLALAIVVVAVLLSLTAAFVGAMNAAAAGLVTTVPFSANVGVILPDNTATLLGLMLSARVTWWVFWVNWYIVTVKWTI